MAHNETDTVLPIIAPPEDYRVDVDVELHEEVYAILEQEAEAHGCSVSSLIRGITNEYANELRQQPRD